jgi:plasmid stabilization system protein ParE
MGQRISWNPKAIKQLRDIVTFLKAASAQQKVEKLSRAIKHQLERLQSQQIERRKAPKAKTIYYVRLAQYYRLYYRRRGATLIVVAFWDTRQNPDKSPY